MADAKAIFKKETLTGTNVNGRTADAKAFIYDKITDLLTRFAADPAKVASEHGALTGSCCFCNKALKDERSTQVGYGSTCAKHYGLPWGA